MKPHKHCEIIKAWADGHEIQIKGVDGVWRTIEPNWNLDWKYRIKPKTIKREGWINLRSIKGACTYGVIGVGGNIFDSEERAKESMIGVATVKVEWEEEE